MDGWNGLTERGTTDSLAIGLTSCLECGEVGFARSVFGAPGVFFFTIYNVQKIVHYIKGIGAYKSTIFKGCFGGNMKPEEILQLRKKMGLSIRAFADKIGVNKATIVNWEQGRHTPKGLSLKVLESMAKRVSKQS